MTNFSDILQNDPSVDASDIAIELADAITQCVSPVKVKEKTILMASIPTEFYQKWEVALSSDHGI